MTENDEKTFTQSELNDLVGSARVKAREKAEEEFNQRLADKEKDATETALKKQDKWQELAEQYEQKVLELEPMEARVESFNEVITTMVDDLLKVFGDSAVKAVEMLDDPLARLNWLNANKDLFESAEGASLGSPRAPKAKSGKKSSPFKVSKLSL